MAMLSAYNPRRSRPLVVVVDQPVSIGALAIAVTPAAWECTSAVCRDGDAAGSLICVGRVQDRRWRACQRLQPAAVSTSRSAVSRRFVAAAQIALAGLLAPDLSGLDLVAVTDDGCISVSTPAWSPSKNSYVRWNRRLHTARF